MSQPEVHISSIVVHVSPDFLRGVKNNIEHLPGAEIYGESDSGKLVVVLESQNQTYITDVIDKINGFEHVLSVALVYHQIEHID